MGIISTQAFTFRLIANGQQLDLFSDEDIQLSNNVTGLFDLGVLPSDFTRQITLPGTKVNNAFFEHVYDISIDNPFLFATNIKVPAYFDFDSVYLSQGYLQLNKVNVIANKFIESYEVTIYGSLSSFGREVNRSYLTDLISLNSYNHTASIQNITASWEGNLFNGDIVYPLAEYGQKIQFNPEETENGIDSQLDGLCVQDFKPAIKAKVVWDAIFAEAGYTYSSSFIDDGGLEDVYLICNRQLRYPVFTEANLETFGLFKIAPFSGSGQTNWQPNSTTDYILPWFNVERNPSGQLQGDLTYNLPYPSSLRGNIQFNVEISGSGVTASLGKVPEFSLRMYDVNSTLTTNVPLNSINNFFADIQQYNGNDGTKAQKLVVAQEFNTGLLPSSSYEFRFNWAKSSAGGGDVVLTLEPNNEIKSFLEVTKVAQLGDGFVMNIPNNMPFGTSGIKQIDFLTSIQKKFNLVIYPSKVTINEFIVEPFTNWYNKGRRWDFNQYINLDEKIEVIPANNLAVNEVTFGDILDQDYISQQFSKEANREFGKSYYVDLENFFSQGKFEVKTSLASTPLIQIANTGASGSVEGLNPNPIAFYAGMFGITSSGNIRTICQGGLIEFVDIYSTAGFITTGATLYFDEAGTLPLIGFRGLLDGCEVWSIDASTGVVNSFIGSCPEYGFPCP
jgi:hypothetical protein